MLATFIENCQYIPVWLNLEKKVRYVTSYLLIRVFRSLMLCLFFVGTKITAVPSLQFSLRLQVFLLLL
jgi:carbon starvation protein CstA